MNARILGTLLLGALALPAQAADIYRWTDDAGTVNYGNVVPERYKSFARKIDTSGSRVVVNGGESRNMARTPALPNEPSASTGAGRPDVTGPHGLGY
jgi:hypothetical protein